MCKQISCVWASHHSKPRSVQCVCTLLHGVCQLLKSCSVLCAVSGPVLCPVPCCVLCAHQVVRLEPSRRYLLTSTRALTAEEKAAFAALVHDRMTEQVWASSGGRADRSSGRHPKPQMGQQLSTASVSQGSGKS